MQECTPKASTNSSLVEIESAAILFDGTCGTGISTISENLRQDLQQSQVYDDVERKAQSVERCHRFRRSDDNAQRSAEDPA